MASHADMPSLSEERVSVRRLVSRCLSALSALSAIDSEPYPVDTLLRVAYLYGYHDAMDQKTINISAVEEELMAKHRRLEHLQRQSEEIMGLIRQTSREIDVLMDWSLVNQHERPTDLRPGLPE